MLNQLLIIGLLCTNLFTLIGYIRWHNKYWEADKMRRYLIKRRGYESESYRKDQLHD